LPIVCSFETLLVGREQVWLREAGAIKKPLFEFFVCFQVAIFKNVPNSWHVPFEMATDQDGPMTHDRVFFRTH